MAANLLNGDASGGGSSASAAAAAASTSMAAMSSAFGLPSSAVAMHGHHHHHHHHAHHPHGHAAASLHGLSVPVGLSMGIHGPLSSLQAEKRKQRRIRTTFTSSQLKVHLNLTLALAFALAIAQLHRRMSTPLIPLHQLLFSVPSTSHCNPMPNSFDPFHCPRLTTSGKVSHSIQCLPLAIAQNIWKEKKRHSADGAIQLYPNLFSLFPIQILRSVAHCLFIHANRNWNGPSRRPTTRTFTPARRSPCASTSPKPEFR